MAMSDQEKHRRNQAVVAYYQKEVAYYQVLFSAWAESRMEHVRRILTLSVLGIGFLASFLVLFHEDIGGGVHTLVFWIAAFAWILAGIAFIATIYYALRIFMDDSEYILEILHEKSERKKGKLLVEYSKILYDGKRWASRLFIFGVSFTFIFVILYGVDLLVLTDGGVK